MSAARRVLAGLDGERVVRCPADGELARRHGLAHPHVLDRHRGAVVVARGRRAAGRDRSGVGAAGPGDVGGARLGAQLARARSRVVVEVRRLLQARAGRRSSGEGRRVGAQRDPGGVPQGRDVSRCEGAEVPLDAGVDAGRIDRGALRRRVGDRGDRHRRDAPGHRRGAGERGSTRVLARGRVVDAAASEVLERRRKIVGDHDRAGRGDVGVLHPDRVDGGLVVDAAQQLALGARLRLGDRQRRDGRRTARGRRGLRVGQRVGNAGRRERGHPSRVRVGVGRGRVRERRAHRKDGRVGVGPEAQDELVTDLQVADVSPDQGLLAGGSGDDRRVACRGRGARTRHVADAQRQHVAERDVVLRHGGGVRARVAGRERVGDRAVGQHPRRARLAQRDPRGGQRRGGDTDDRDGGGDQRCAHRRRRTTQRTTGEHACE